MKPVLIILSLALLVSTINAELVFPQVNKLSLNNGQVAADFTQHVSVIKNILNTPLSALSLEFVPSKSGFQSQSVSTACSSAWQTLVAANDKCLRAIVADMVTLEHAAPHAGHLCNAALPVNCAEVAASVSTIQTNCTASELSENLVQAGAADLWKNATGFALLCTKDNNKEYCLSAIGSLETNFTSKGVITNATVSQICGSTCFSKMFKMAVASGAVDAKDASSMNVLCSKDTNTNEYCYPQIVGGFMDSSNSDISGIAKLYCSPCLRKMMAAMDASSFAPPASINMMNKIIPSFCVSDGREYCMAAMPRMMDSFSKLASAGDNICPVLRTIISNQTCCLTSLLNAFNDIQSLVGGSPPQGQDDTLASFRQVTDACKVTMPSACATSKVVAASLKFPTLKYSYYVANKNAVDSAVKKDMASFADVLRRVQRTQSLPCLEACTLIGD